LPDLGEGFVEACLYYLNYEPERAINSILEGPLPAEVSKMDRKMKKWQRPPSASKPASVIESRRNIFQNDEFDILANQTIDANKVYKKEVKVEKQGKVMNDKTGITNKVKSRILEMQYEYEDEYDDSYDEFTGNFKIGSEQTNDQAIAAVDSASEDEDAVENEESEEGNSTNQKGGESKEEETPTQEGRGGFMRGRGRGTGPVGGPNPTPRGRGRGKTSSSHQHKSHHRKEQSMKKRGGMFPSQP